MRRRPTLAALAALCSLAFLVTGCGGDDGDDTSETTTTEAATTAPQAEDAEVDCNVYRTVVGLIASTEEIATGSSEGQVTADDVLATGVDALALLAEGDEIVIEALQVLGRVSFQVTDAADGPTVDEIDSAVVTLEDTWGDQCPAEPAECPAPETLEAQGLQCDAEGNVTPVVEGSGDDGGAGAGEGDGGTEGEATGECPAPEVLEAEGFSCDSEGNLTPLDEETVTECPAPEVLEAEGFTCDSEGHLTPVE